MLLTEVLRRSSPASEKNFCIVDAAMNDLMRPALYDAWMAIAALRAARRRRRAAGTWSARSASRATGWAATARWRSQPGDLLAVLSAGAYGMSDGQQLQQRGRAPPR
ncbi:MAG: hypothetical protein MZW92_63460 [Comamonadaceae bacterium]|nr:hypothetical protein [Comamonadaceae bacterium]